MTRILRTLPSSSHDPCAGRHPECAHRKQHTTQDGNCVCVWQGCPGGVTIVEPC